MALTQGQQQAADYLKTIQGRSAADYYTPASQDMIMSDPEIQNALQSSEGAYDQNYINKLIADRTASLNGAGGGQGLAQQTYNKYLQEAQTNVDWWNANPNGHDDFLTNFMSTVIPAIVIGGFTAGAAGLFGDAAGVAGGSASSSAGAGLGDLSAAGLGQLPIDTAALGPGSVSFAGLGGGMDALGATTAAAAGAGSATAGGLGSMIGVEGGAPAVVSVGAPAASSGLGAAGLGGAALGTAGLTNILGSNPTLPIDSGALQTPANIGGVQVPESSLPPLVTPPLASNSAITNVNPVADGAANIPYTPPVYGSGSTPTTGGLPSTGGLGSIIGGLAPILGGINDYKNSQADQDFWKGQLDTLMGMYKPGTAEATQMEDKMNALDAANGRNSQYGVRAVNLASNLASNRANIMTSAGYQNMANAYRNRSSQSLNGLFSAAGNASTQNLLSSAGNTIANLFN